MATMATMATMAAVRTRADDDDAPPGLWSSERAFRVMGTDAHVLVWQEDHPLVAPADLLDLAESELRRLEQRWSRFVPGSDVSRVSAAAGTPVAVATETMDVLRLALRGREVSDGCFDPTLLRELEAAGYDRSFDDLAGTPAADLPPVGPTGVPVAPRRGGELELDPDRGTARIDPAHGLDLGGIGKGRAADVVAGRLLVEGALGACVNLGGDLRVVGETAPRSGITVGVDDVLGGHELRTVLHVRNAAVATSSNRRRAWTSRDGTAHHHIIDPVSGRSSTSSLAGVTVVAPTAAWAEIAATTAFLRGPAAGAAFLEELGFAALLVSGDGVERRVAGLERFER